MVVHDITSFEQFEQLINGDKPIIIDFWATWCRPCKIISPIFELLSNTTDKVGFFKVDVDARKRISQEVSILVLPTFVAFYRGVKIGEVCGARAPELQALVEQMAGL